MDNNKIEKNIVRLESVKKIQKKNIDAILAQADKLKILEEKAEELEEDARIFSKTAHQLKMKITWKRKRDKIAVLGVVFFIVFFTYIIGSPIYVVLSIALGGGVVFGILYGNDQKTEKFNSNNFSKNSNPLPVKKKKKDPILNPSIQPTFNNFKSKNKKNKNKSSCSENKISYAPKK